MTTTERTYTFKELLLSVAPNEHVPIFDLWETYGGDVVLTPPKQLPLYCGECKGERLFEPTESTYYLGQTTTIWRNYLGYQCRNCKLRSKIFALHLARDKAGTKSGKAMKFGESPAFGPPVPANVEALLGSDASLFRKGIDSEAKGLGIGAFAYYRRVLDNQRTKIFDKIIQVARKLGAEEEVLKRLTAARDDRQFTKSIDEIKPGPLKAIYIDGHNPLTLLYDAVSDGLHGQSDAENLAQAQIVRLLIADLARRIEAALDDHAEVSTAVNNLLKAQAARRSKSSSGNSQSSIPTEAPNGQSPTAQTSKK